MKLSMSRISNLKKKFTPVFCFKLQQKQNLFLKAHQWFFKVGKKDKCYLSFRARGRVKYVLELLNPYLYGPFSQELYLHT